MQALAWFPIQITRFYVKQQNTEQEGLWPFAKVLSFVQRERTLPDN